MVAAILLAGIGQACAAGNDVGARLETQGLLLTMLFVFAAGVLVSLTPCVYPMVPITLSIIGARSVGQKPIVGFLRSLVFVLGIAVIYSALGLLVARSNRTFGFVFQNKWFVAAIALFFVAMGLSMLGMFTIQLPARFAGKLQGTGNRGGYVGAFILGLITGIVASPCGSPVLLSVLIVAAKSGQAIVGFSLLFMYALGIGLLFLVLGTFPAFLKVAPRSGIWMEDIKKLLGAVLIGVGAYYLRLVLPPALFWPLVLVLLLAGSVYVTWSGLKRSGSPVLSWTWRVVGVCLAIAAIFVAVGKVPQAIAGNRELPGSIINGTCEAWPGLKPGMTHWHYLRNNQTYRMMHIQLKK